jgi:hypothetical protein
MDSEWWTRVVDTDRGTWEWWTRNGALYTDMRMAVSRDATFLPEVLPQALARLPMRIDHLLEFHRLALYSAHDIAALRKPA